MEEEKREKRIRERLEWLRIKIEKEKIWERIKRNFGKGREKEGEWEGNKK